MYVLPHRLSRFRTLSCAAALLVSPLATAGEVRFAGEGHAEHPVFSADGKYVAFDVNRFSNRIEMFISAVTGEIAKDGVKVNLPGQSSQFGGGDQVAINPTWHPQGMAVFEGSNQGGEYRLYIVSGAGGQAAEMIGAQLASGNLTFPAVAPDGNNLGFISSQSGNGDVRTWNRSTNKVDQISATEFTEAFPSFSKDGKKLLYSRKKDNTEDIFEMDLTTKQERAIVGGGGDQTRPVYAAGGKVVFFTSERDGHWDLAVIDNGAKTILAKDVELPVRAKPALSPDGQWVAYSYSDPAQDNKIILKKVDGSATVEVPTEFKACREPAIGVQNGRTLLAFTYLRPNDSDWRKLFVMDVTDKL